jgi:regulation of enolase protein 1 (concanavalin A-like superfamily)
MYGCVPVAALRAPVMTVLFVCGAAATSGAQTVPAPWTARDIGAPQLSGSSSASSSGFHIDAAGADIWNARDEFHFVYQQVSGDVDIVARVDALAMTDVWAKAGVMIRSSLAANASHGFAIVSAAYGVHFQRRRTDGAESHSTPGYTPGPSVWVRAVRAGTRVTAYWSPDGTRWSEVGSDTIALGSSAYVGVAVTSHHPGLRTSARVGDVRLTTAAPQGGLPAGQQSMDVGGPAISGRAAFSNGTYAIRAGGIDIWDTSDQFHFVYQSMTGNGEIVARVASIGHTDMWAKAGVMIRESLTGASRHAMVVTTPAAGYAFQRRPETGAWSEHTTGGVGTAPGWVRLVRTGHYFEAYRSSNGSTWTRIGADSIPMGDTVYVGLAVTSHNAAVATDVIVDHVTMRISTTTTAAPRAVVFTASSDHATNVTSYLFEVFANGANPATATPVASSDLGKPAPASDGTVTVDRSTFFSNLAPGTYVATVTAIGPGGRTRGGTATFTR